MVAAVATAWLLLWVAACVQSEQDFYDFKAVNIRGKLVSLEKYRGSVSGGPLRAWRWGWGGGRGLQGPPKQGLRADATLGCAQLGHHPGHPSRAIGTSGAPKALAHSALRLRGTAQEPPALSHLALRGSGSHPEGE